MDNNINIMDKINYIYNSDYNIYKKVILLTEEFSITAKTARIILYLKTRSWAKPKFIKTIIKLDHEKNYQGIINMVYS